ncbi:MAG TPA: DedA family protein [Thermoplasmata archaeon]|nr:DedA family protein [Thermoplasmata archaeon]
MAGIPIIETVVTLITTVMLAGSYAGIVALMFFESLGIPPLPSEIILPLAGSLVVLNGWSLPGVLAAALLGGLLGSYAGYAIGRWGRHWVTSPKLGPLALRARHLEAIDVWCRRRGESTVAVARLVPVVRSYISFPAGTARMEPVRFGLYTLFGSIPFTAALVYAGVTLGQHWTDVVATFRYLDYAAAAGIILALGYIFYRWRREDKADDHSE